MAFFASQPSNIVILGDAAGSGISSWVRLLASNLSRVWPTARIEHRLYNTGTSSYGAAKVLWDGGGSTLTIYNGAGSTADYPDGAAGRLAAMVPVTPDALVVAFGHSHGSDTVATFEGKLDALLSAVETLRPGTPVVVSSQNHEKSPYSTRVEHNARQAALAAYASANSYGYINTYETFLAHASPDSLVKADGVSPTDSGLGDGSHVWAGAAKDFLGGADSPAYANLTFTQMMAALKPEWWARLGESSGTTMTDASGNARHGTYYNSPTLGVAGAVIDGDTAASFDGSIQYGMVDYAAWMNPPTFDYTLLAFAASSDDDGAVIGRTNLQGPYVMSLSSGSGFYFEVRSSSGGWYARDLNSTDARDGTWHFLVGTARPGYVTAYVDGVQVGQNGGGAGPTGTPLTGTSPLNVARRVGGPYLLGSVDEPAIFYQALTPQQIADLNTKASSVTAGGTLEGAAPTPVGAFTGTVPTTGALAGVAPSPEGHFTGTAPTAGSLDGTAPTPVGAFTGSAGSVLGGLNGTAPTPEGAFTGIVAVVGEINGTAPAPVGAFLGDVTTTAGADEMVGVAPSPVGAFEGVVNGGDSVDNVPFRYGFGVGFLEIPTAIPAPAGIDTVPVVRESHVAPALSAANPVLTQGVDYPWVNPVEVGELHTFVDGVDVTYLGGAPIRGLRRSSVSPHGDVSAEFEVPSMEVWNKAGTGDFSMLRPDAEVEHVLIRPDDSRVHLWGGFLSADFSQVIPGRGGSDHGSRSHGFTAEGLLWQAGHTLHQPEHYLPLTDIGTLIPDALNKAPAKRWADVPRVTTGLYSRHRGAGNDTVMKYVNDLLAEYGWTEDGRQWTLVEVAKGEIRMQLKAAMTAADATVTHGAFGIEVKLSREQSTRIDVIYGKGVTAHGGQWRGTRFPGLILATPPEYPNTDARTIFLGDTDADTDSGDGVSTWQRRMVELGYALTVDGVMNSNDVDAMKRIQRKMGLLDNGTLGPQTWSGTFNRGPEEIDLSVWREPIAAASWAQKYHRDPSGIILSENPDYDPTRIPHEVEIDFGTNITWQQAQPIAERMLLVEQEPGLTGTIRLRTDPHECWKGEIKPGWRVKVVGFQGEDVLVRVAAVDVDHDDDGMVVTLTVDERARDAMSVAAVLERNRAAMNDPARRPGNPQRDSRNERDRYVQWDIDSPCGFMPRTAVISGLWVAPNPIPFSEVGQVVRTVMSSTVPFAMMLFGLPVKPSQVQFIDPFASSDPYRPHTEYLERLGWIEAWGSDGQRLGYYPGDENAGYAFSGKSDLRGSFDYVSGYGVYVWPVFYSATTGFVGGGSGEWVSRFYPGTWA